MRPVELHQTDLADEGSHRLGQEQKRRNQDSTVLYRHSDAAGAAPAAGRRLLAGGRAYVHGEFIRWPMLQFLPAACS
jgi:hypothetical protein